MKNLILIFSVFFLLLACKREKMWFNDTTVEGILLDSATLEPLKDIEVTLYRWKNKTAVIRGNYAKYIVIKTTDTDEIGGFKIKFNRVDNRNYYINFKYDHILYDEYINNEYTFYMDSKIDSIIKYKYIYLVKR